MYLYGASEIVASDFRPKLPARTIMTIQRRVPLKLILQEKRISNIIFTLSRMFCAL